MGFAVKCTVPTRKRRPGASLELSGRLWTKSGTIRTVSGMELLDPVETEKAMARVATLQKQAQKALASGDVDNWQRLTRDLRLAERERDALWERQALAQHRGPNTALPVPTSREQTREVLERTGVPMAPQQVIAFHSALYDEEIPYKAITSLRHDEKRAYTSRPGARSYYVVPPLNHDNLAPARGLLALSTWPLEDRIVGPLTPRTSHLRLTLFLVNELDRARSADDDRPEVGLERLLWRFSSTIAGLRRGEADTGRVREAAESELKSLIDRDLEDRSAATERVKLLDERQQLFGAPLRAVGGKSRRATGGGR